MNWHQKPDWTGFTWDTSWYPDHIGLLSWLHSRGLYTGANIHDAEGVKSHELRYPAMAQANGVAPNGTVDFDIGSKTYYTSLRDLVMEPLAREGLDMWWTDWQQGLGDADTTHHNDSVGTLGVAGLNPTIWLNHLRFTNYSGSDRRGQILSRYGGLGNSRYAVGFGGDVRQSWESLEAMVFTTMTSINVAFPWWGQEIMSRMALDTVWREEDLELFTRVTQFGAWSPVYTNYGNPSEDCNYWLFPPKYRDGSQRATAQRAMTLPLRYTLARIAHDTGLGPMRPMYYPHPQVASAYEQPHQFFLGEDLLVAPVFKSLAKSTTTAQTIWLPPPRPAPLAAKAGGETDTKSPGEKIGLVTFASMSDGSKPAQKVLGTAPADSGATTFTLDGITLDEVPVLVRRDAAIPMLPYTQAVAHGSASRAFETLELWMWANGDGHPCEPPLL